MIVLQTYPFFSRAAERGTITCAEYFACGVFWGRANAGRDRGARSSFSRTEDAATSRSRRAQRTRPRRRLTATRAPCPKQLAASLQRCGRTPVPTQYRWTKRWADLDYELRQKTKSSVLDRIYYQQQYIVSVSVRWHAPCVACLAEQAVLELGTVDAVTVGVAAVRPS